ncbi:CLIP domain-containing serine protease B10-like [Tigriopus californicus]|uniref:CLIP domain-containing serine protease B10-like n=1 Tax=Tigriopus californicus TaxID=6832 RepID=UPI0027DA8278|nr:CLIP domain-containing serine protease B10-like [Tigriopus californicus]|eukprot:TCALIF_07512-PA protein Name:"Similar to Chymotrypsinogen A (Bos taurus)" AED:0.06 eAED:0.06 QI:25/1/1/1/1/1/4/559/486
MHLPLHLVTMQSTYNRLGVILSVWLANLAEVVVSQCVTIPTVEGTEFPERCRFPFEYDGELFNACTTFGDDSNRSWCSVEVDDFGRHVSGRGRWGYCDSASCQPQTKKKFIQTGAADCRTFAGFRPNRACVFPFILEGRVYNSCTPDYDPNGVEWCSTKVDAQGKHITGEWGYCSCQSSGGSGGGFGSKTTRVQEECPNSERNFQTSIPSSGEYMPNPNECGQPLNNLFVIGGRNASVEEFPFLALLGYEGIMPGQTLWGCGGVLINRRYVITAAHCSKFPQPTVVRLGELNVETDCDCNQDKSKCSKRTQDVGVEDILVHAGYDKSDSFRNDIALLRLDRPVDLTSSVTVVCLPQKPPFSGDLNGKDVTVVGWGMTRYNDPGSRETLGVITPVLQKTQLPVVDIDECNLTWRGKVRSSIQICAGGPGVDSCNGDSGGPLLLKDNGGRYGVVGLVSFGKSTCGDGDPGVYVRVETFLRWIRQNIRP